MGIYDRDYVRREGYTFLGSFTERGRVCKWIIGINIVAFIVQILTLERGSELGWFTDAFDLSVQKALHGQVWRFLTYAFLHDPGTIWHILFNMLFLWWFGTDVEDLYGPREFLTFYLSASVFGGVLFFVSSLVWVPNTLPCLGASGGVLAVLTLCAIHFPRRSILLFFILPIPLPLFLLFTLAGDAYVFLNKANSSTAVAAHLGGAIFAGLYYRLRLRLFDWVPPLWERDYWQGLRRKLFGPRLRLYVDDTSSPRSRQRGEERHPSTAAARSHAERANEEIQGKHHSVSAPVADEHLEAKMDAILEKLGRVGMENLTESEREFLLRASEILRRRRT